MSATEERTALKAAATELIKLLHDLNTRLNPVINELVRQQDLLIGPVMDEHEAERHITSRTIRYAKPITPTPKIITFDSIRKPGKRHCSICGEAGHRATTCTKGRKK